MNIHPRNKTLSIILFSTISILGLSIATLYIFPRPHNNDTSALTYSNESKVSFTFSPMISISVSSNTIDIPTIVPGTTVESTPITVTVGTNTAYGYSLYADVGNSTDYNTDSLVHISEDNPSNPNNPTPAVFTNIPTNASLSQLTTDNTWGYSFKPSNESNWSVYNGLPLYTTTSSHTSTSNPALLIDTKDPGDNKSIDFKIAARASATQPSGTYNNVINFYAVGKPEPPPDELTFIAGDHIETLIVADSSQNWKPFYTTSTNSNNSIVFTAPAKNTKYIVTVVPEPGYVLSSDSNSSSYIEEFSTGALASNTLLTTAYSAGSAGDNIAISASRAGSDAAHPAYTAMQSLTATQCPVISSSGQQGINVTDARDGKSYTVAKFGGYCYMLSNIRVDGGTTLTPATSHVSSGYTLPADTGSGSWPNGFCQSHMASINGEYYYNWLAATAGTKTGCTYYDTVNSLGDICPAGWALPTYWDIAPDFLWGSGANLGMLSASGYFGYSYSSSRYDQYNVGSYGYWWSSKQSNISNAYNLSFDGAKVSHENSSLSEGYPVRCMRSS